MVELRTSLPLGSLDEARILSCTIPLLHRDNGHAPQLVGTAVGLVVAKERFLLTAGHVIDEFVDREFWLAHGGEITPFSGRAERNVTPGQDRSRDLLDVGVIRVDDGQVESLTRDCLAPAELGLREWQSPAPDGYLFGYPCTRTKADRSLRQMRFGHFPYHGDRLSASSLLACNRHADVHVGLAYDPRRTTRDGKLVTPPKLTCVSGAGIWHVPRLLDAASTEGPTLTAIFTDHLRERRLIIGTRIALHCELIRASWPHLCSQLGKHGRLEVRVQSEGGGSSSAQSA